MNRFVLLLFFVSLIFLIIPSDVFASSITYSSTQTNLNVGDEFLVDTQLSVSASSGTVYYLRGEFYQNEGSYCGFTWNGNGWYNGPYGSEGWKNLLQVSIQDSSWSGQLKAKIDGTDSSCLNSGDYNFRIQRYTLSGSSSSDTQTPIIVSVSIPTPSPTLAPTSSPAPTTQPTSSPTPTKSPSPSPLPTKTPTPRPNPTKSPSSTPQSSGLVLGSENVKTPVASPVPQEISGKSSHILAFALVGVGISLIGFSGYLAFKKQKETSPQNTI